MRSLTYLVTMVTEGSLAPGLDMPSAQSLVGWLLERQEVTVPDLSDTDSLSSVEVPSDSDSMSDEFEDLEGVRIHSLFYC